MQKIKSRILLVALAFLFVGPYTIQPYGPITAMNENDGIVGMTPDVDSSPNIETPLDNYGTAAIPSTTTGSGSLIPVLEYSNGTFPIRTSYANMSSTFYPQTYDIPAGWHTTSIIPISSQMYHLKDWVSNGDFSSITDWSAEEDDLPSALTENYDSINDWITIVRVSGGKVKYDYWGSWNQTVQVDEGGTASAVLSVTFKIDTSNGVNGQNAQPYLFVNGTVWELPTNGERFSYSQDWTTFEVDLPLDDFTFPGSLEIAFGIRGFADTQFQNTGTLTCDNVTLTLRTSRRAEVTQLNIRDSNEISNNADFITDLDDGYGYAPLTGNWTDQVQLEFTANETNTEFGLILVMELIRNSEFSTNTYSVSNGTDVTWDSEFTAREMPFPFIYDYFTVEIPDDWTLVTVYDAYDDLQLTGTTYYNATFYPATSLLVCDVNGTGPSGTPHYGTWSIASTSPNYGDSLTFWGESGSTWTETSTFYPGSPLRVDAVFSDSLSNPPDTFGTGTITFYDVEEIQMFSESGGVLDSGGSHTYQNGTDPSNITIQSSWLAGPITTVATWTNGTAVGEVRDIFEIHHHTELELEFPVYQAYRGDTVSIRVKYVDSETGLGIAGASLYFNWTYGSGVMGYAGNGWYAGAIDSSISPIGAYLITTNASKPYNDFATITGITVEIQERTILYSPKDLGTPTTDYEIAWGNSKTIYLAYEDSIAMNPTVLTPIIGTPTSSDIEDTYTSNNIHYSISSSGNAISLIVETDVSLYDFVSADLTSLTFKLEGRFSQSVNYGEVFAYNYSSSSWVSIIDSYSPTIDIALTWKTKVPTDFISGTGEIRARINATHDSAFTYDIDLFDFVATRPIDDNAPDALITADWPAQTTVGTQIGPIYNDTLKIWQVTFNSEGVTPGDYIILIEASATGHQDKTLELTVLVRAHHSRLSASPPSETPWSWKTYVTVTFADTDNSSIIITESNISSIQVDSSFGTEFFGSGNWTYDDSSGTATIGFWIDTSSWNVGSHSVTITLTTSGSGLSKYFDDGSTVVEIVIRPHDVSVSISPPGETPWSWKTNVSVTLTDIDNSTFVDPLEVSQIIVAGQTFTSSDWTYSDGIFAFYVDTSVWSISSDFYDVSVVMFDSPRLYNDGIASVKITIRSHILIVTASTQSATPWGWETNLYVVLLDLDNSSSEVTPTNIASITIAGQTFTSVDWTYSAGKFTIVVDTSAWSIGTAQHTVSVTTQTGPKLYTDGSAFASIEIRAHYIGVSVSPPGSTPWDWTTDISVTITDLDNLTIVNEANITSITIDGNVFTSADWSYAAGVFTFTLDTSGWSIGSSIYTVSVDTASGPEVYLDAQGSVTIEIRQHNIGIIVSPPSATPWSWSTEISITITDLDDNVAVSESDIASITIDGVAFTSSDWVFSAGVFTCTLDTSSWSIGSASYDVNVISNAIPSKLYTDTSGSVLIRVVGHTIAVETIRPVATPWSETTTIVINLYDVNNETIIIQSNNVTSITIGGTEYFSWTWDNGMFTIVVDTSLWAIGTYSNDVDVVTAGSGVTKYFGDGTSSVVIDIRTRYSEAYAPSPDPVPYPDNLVFYVEFRDRDASGALVDLDSISLNGSDLVLGVDFTYAWVSEGYYEVSLVTSSLSIGNHEVIVTCQLANYENATTTVRFRIRLPDTEALASGYRFNIPIGSNATFTITYNDIDHSEGILGALIVNNESFSWSWMHIGNGVYQIEVEILDSTPIAEYTIRFDITNASYEAAYVIIVISAETHATYLSYDEPPLPTDIGVDIEAYMYYEDISLSTGIANDTFNVVVYVNYTIEGGGSGFAEFTVQDNIALGTGHYLILMPADQFGGLYNISFTVHFEWSGVAKYENLTRTFSIELLGTQTGLSVAIAPQAIYYGDWINFTLDYVDSSGGGIVDDGNVSATAIVIGESIDPSNFIIIWVSEGYYAFALDSSLFTADGSFTIQATLGWDPTKSPWYDNQTLSITITILNRPTLVDIAPPQNTAYGEIATFSFTYYDSPTNTYIANSTQIYVQLDNIGIQYWLNYDTGIWTITVNTITIGSIGDIGLLLNITWAGAPFYQNQTRTVSLDVTARPSQLSYTAPLPTYFDSNVTMVFTYSDLIDASSAGMDGSTVTITSSGVTLSGNYTVVDNGDGTYSLALDTIAFLEPGLYSVNASITYVGTRFCADAYVIFNIRVLVRAILATSEPVGSIAWLENIDVILHVTDGETTDLVANTTQHVRITIDPLNASALGGIVVSWTPGTDKYSVSIENTLAIGTYIILLNVSYDYAAPYYGSYVVQLTISIRAHSTEIQLYSPPAQTGFGLNTTFQLYYVDLDTSQPISGATLLVNESSLAGSWEITPIGGNLYEVTIDTAAFLAIGTYWVQIITENTGGLENYANTTILVRVYVRERYTNLVYDAISTVGYTDNVTITVYYTDSDLGNAGITNDTYAIQLTVNQTTYYVEYGATNGSFVIIIPADQFVAFKYTNVEISVSYSGDPFYQSQTITVRFQVAGTSTEFAWDPSDPIPYGDIANITFYWGDSDSNQPIAGTLGANFTITVESITQPTLDTGNPSILQIVQGLDSGEYSTFFLILNTTYLDTYDTYVFKITIDWVDEGQSPFYEDQLDKSISLIVRMRDTAIPQVQAESISYGENATIRLQYVDMDSGSQLIEGGALNILVLDGLIYSVNPIPVGGFYEIEIVTEGTGLLGTIRVNITVSWVGKPFYENQTAVYVVLSINPRTPTMEIEFPATTPYQDNVTFYIILQDALSSEYINNNESFISAVFKIPSIADLPSITYIALSNGRYRITFTSTIFSQVGSFTLELTFDNQPYFYVLQRNVTGVVRERATNLDYEPVSAVPYGNTTEFTVTFTDVDSSTGIDSAQIYLVCGTSTDTLELNTNYWVSLEGSGVYTITIDTSALGSPDSYSIDIIANSTADWWIAERTRTMTINVAYRNVELSPSSPDTSYYGETTFFTVTLTDIDTGPAGTGLAGMESYISVVFVTPFGTSNATVSIVHISSGVYNISFSTTILGELTDYVVAVSFNPLNVPDYWESTSPRLVTGRVNARPTQLSYDVLGSTPYLDNITITITFTDGLTSIGVTDASVVLTSVSATLILNNNYWITDHNDGTYTARIDSTAFVTTGDFVIDVDMTTTGSPYYQNRSTSIPVQVRDRATRVTYVPPAETPFGNNLTVILRYYDVDAGLIGIEGAATNFTLETINGTIVDSSYYWIIEQSEGEYWLVINTTKLDAFGHYELEVSVAGMASYNYDDQSISFNADIRARNTQLTTAPIAQTSYTENATVTFYYMDNDADVGVTNDTTGIVLTLVALNSTTSWWIEELGDGTYELKLDASGLGSTGNFFFEATFTWINGKPFFDNQTLTFSVSITGSSATLTYIPPAHVPIGDDIVITIEYRDSGTGDGIANGSGYVHITITPLNSTIMGPFQYWIDDSTPGVYIYTINSTPFWTTGPLFFEFDVNWAKDTLPYYPNITGTVIRSVIRDINTQTLADAPDPGSAPMGDNVSVIITYYDLDHDVNIFGADIDSDWIYGWSYEILGDGRFNITLLTVGITTPGKISVVFTFNRTFYLTRISTVQITMREAATVSTTTSPDPAIVPIGDTVTIEVTYYDIDHQVNITDGDIVTDWIYGWSWVRVIDGGFIVTLYTDTVPNMITYTVTFTVSKSGYLDAYSSAKFEVRLIRTGISADVPSNLVAGDNATVTITFEDLDHGTGIEGATIHTNAPGGTYAWVEIGSGVYEITYYLWEELAGTYNYDITGAATDHDPASLNVDLDLRQVRTDLYMPVTYILVNWSDSFTLEVTYENLDLGGLVEDATVTATISGIEYILTSNGTYYIVIIDSSVVDVGTYVVNIIANKTNHETRIFQITVVVAVLETQFSSINGLYYSIYSGGSIELLVYFESLAFGGVTNALVNYTWDIGSGPVEDTLVSNGTAGFYTIVVNSAGADTNIYTLYIRATKMNYAEARIYISVDVGVVETELAPVGEAATIIVVFGENATISVNYTVSGLFDPISNATLNFRFDDAPYNGNLTEVAPGIYNATLDSNYLSAGSYSLRITALKAGFEYGSLLLILEISTVDTELVAVNALESVVYLSSVTYTFNYTDIHNNLQIEDALVSYTWAGGAGQCVDEGDGIYSLTIDSTEVIPNQYPIYITADKTNYEFNTAQVLLTVLEIETEIQVAEFYETPVGDAVTIQIHFHDVSYNESITEATGVAIWLFGNPALVEGTDGNYTFTMPGNVSIEIYSITFRLSKSNYETKTVTITVSVREIVTSLHTLSGNDFITVLAGELADIVVEYWDIDHNLPITGADISILPAGVLDDAELTITESTTAGQYIISFRASANDDFSITIHAELGVNYDDKDLPLTIVIIQPEQDPLFLLFTLGGSLGIIGLLIGALLYVKIFSVPKLIRIMNGMIKKLSKGKVPDDPEMPARALLIQAIVNEGLIPVGIEKPIDEIPDESIEFAVPETEALLEELAEITGLTQKDVDIFRTDLARMEPSERPGFLMEVIKQEKARRAQEIAEKAEQDSAARKVTPEELELVKEKLLKLGIDKDQVELIIENAGELTKAELDALVENMDGFGS